MNLYDVARPMSELWARIPRIGDWQGVRFLCYHGVYDRQDSIHPQVRSLSITAHELRSHLCYFRNSEINVISLETALQLLENGIDGKTKYLCLTFDDGDLNHYTTARVILKEFGFSAHFFVVSGHIGASHVWKQGSREWHRTYMAEDHLNELLNDGNTIGSHGKTHSILTKLDLHKLNEEVQKSKKEIEATLGISVSTFAFPGSSYDSAVVAALNSAGYRYAFRVDYGSVRDLGVRNRYAIPRNLIMGNQAHVNYLTFRGGYDWARFYSAIKRKIREQRGEKRAVAK
jgi:peptidoglycan/xylan/chitin deacetylase (PgdA/CDA1 family)